MSAFQENQPIQCPQKEDKIVCYFCKLLELLNSKGTILLCSLILQVFLLDGVEAQGNKIEKRKFQQMTPIQDKAKPTVLIGRIQEIASPTPRMPEAAKNEVVDLGRLPPAQNNPNTYPADFQGLWSGDFVVTKIPGATASNGSILYPGRIGSGQVGFSKSADSHIIVDPLPIVYFETTTHGRVHVGFGTANHVHLTDGSLKDATILSNKIRLLSDGHTIEQQIFEESEFYRPRTHERFKAARESVFQFSKEKSGILDVNLAAVEYKRDGTIMSRIIMHGRLFRQNAFVPEEAKQDKPSPSNNMPPKKPDSNGMRSQLDRI